MPSRSEAQIVEVSARELPKMRYLVDTVYLMDAMYQDFKTWRDDVAFTQAVTVDAQIDWRAVVHHCAPQVLVVLAHDPGRAEFMDFPLYAVLPESGQVIRLDGVISLSVEADEDGKPELDVRGALNSLTAYVDSIDGGKKENAVRQLQILKRILR